MILFICCFICGVLSAYLAGHTDYEDGIIGKIALAFIVIPSGIVVWEYASGVEYVLQPVTQIILIGFTAFLVRHVYRFMKWRKTGEGDWKKNEKVSSDSSVVCPLLTSPRKKVKRRNSNSPRQKAI